VRIADFCDEGIKRKREQLNWETQKSRKKEKAASDCGGQRTIRSATEKIRVAGKEKNRGKEQRRSGGAERDE